MPASRSLYNDMAAAIRYHVDHRIKTTLSPNDRALIRDLAACLKRDNPGFKTERFLSAAGVDK